MDCPRSGVQDQSGQQGKTLSLLKIQKISWVRWQAPIISATGEAKAGESLEPGKLRLHCSLGDKSKTERKKEARKEETKERKRKKKKRECM